MVWSHSISRTIYYVVSVNSDLRGSTHLQPKLKVRDYNVMKIHLIQSNNILIL